MRTIDRRPGYRSVYGETTKWASEASAFNQHGPGSRDGAGAKRSEVARLEYPRCWARTSCSTNAAFQDTFLSRRNNPLTDRMLIVMQRVNDDDFAGNVLGLGGEWTVLNLPAVAETDEADPFTTFMGDHVYSRTSVMR